MARVHFNAGHTSSFPELFQTFYRAEVRSIVFEQFLLRYKEQATAVPMQIVQAANMAVHVGCLHFQCAQFSRASDVCFVMVAVILHMQCAVHSCSAQLIG